MPHIIDYPLVVEQMTRQRFVSLYPNSGAFGFPPESGAASLGWIGPDGAMQTSILIRTFVADGRRLTLHVGGGITWGSVPALEWEETVAKARGPLGALGGEEVAS